MSTIVRQHQGSNIKRLRDILGVKQGAIAVGLGIPQQRVSELEQHAVIDDATLEKISEILHVPVDRIKEFSEEGLIQYVTGNTFENNESGIGIVSRDYHYNNPIGQITELFERLLKEKDERIAQLEKELAKSKS